MINGLLHAVVTVNDETIELKNTQHTREGIIREDVTYRNKIADGMESDGTDERRETVFGYRYEEIFTVQVAPSALTLQAIIDQNNDANREMLAHKLIRCVDYSQRGYAMTIYPRADLQGAGFSPYSVTCELMRMDQGDHVRGHVVQVRFLGTRPIASPVPLYRDAGLLIDDGDQALATSLVVDDGDHALATSLTIEDGEQSLPTSLLIYDIPGPVDAMDDHVSDRAVVDNMNDIAADDVRLVDAMSDHDSDVDIVDDMADHESEVIAADDMSDHESEIIAADDMSDHESEFVLVDDMDGIISEG